MSTTFCSLHVNWHRFGLLSSECKTSFIFGRPFYTTHSLVWYSFCSLLQRGDQRGPFHGNGRSGGSGQGGAGKRGMFQGNVRPGNTVQDGGGRGQGRARGHDRSRVPASAADLDAELEQYHAAAVKQK
ncbi:unnamed protein product [Triticum turgidum subsp. durum]|uniref:Chromatin target of PRMT1 protein C-terminal domain-containing protein n=1 Tax=Triticum turgidum subsp. durum TaxID=4567 RepID=A0A9R1R6R1_TRITD|nr:unnamed protein product [Triticum turgidum subsp. durum]